MGTTTERGALRRAVARSTQPRRLGDAWTRGVTAVALLLALVMLVPGPASGEPGIVVFDDFPFATVSRITDDGLAVVDDGLFGGLVYVWTAEDRPIRLQDLPGSTIDINNTGVTGVNQRGDVVGVSYDEAFLFSHDEMRVHMLDDGGLGWAGAYDVAEDGVAAGVISEEPGWETSHAAAWTGSDHALELLGDPLVPSYATDVNANGTVVGFTVEGDGAHVMRWDLGGGEPIDLTATVGAGPGLDADLDLNDRDQLLTTTYDPLASRRTGNSLLDLATMTTTMIPVAPFGAPEPQLNERGEVAYVDADGSVRIWRSVTGETVTAFGPGPAAPLERMVFDDAGQVLIQGRPENDGRATLWDPIRGAIDLGPDYATERNVASLSNTGLVGGTLSSRAGFLAELPLVPFAPASATAVVDAGGALGVAWAPASQPGVRPTTRFQVRIDGVAAATVDAATTTWAGAVADPTAAHTIEVVAVNVAGASLATVATVTAPAAPTSSATAAPTSSSAAVPVAATPAFTG